MNQIRKNISFDFHHIPKLFIGFNQYQYEWEICKLNISMDKLVSNDKHYVNELFKYLLPMYMYEHVSAFVKNVTDGIKLIS